MITFQECEICAAKPGSPSLCRACLHNRATISQLVAALRVAIDGWSSLERADRNLQKIDSLRKKFELEEV